jgi:hypothetical protein
MVTLARLRKAYHLRARRDEDSVAIWKQISMPARPRPEKNPYDTTSAIFTMSKKFVAPKSWKHLVRLVPCYG